MGQVPDADYHLIDDAIQTVAASIGSFDDLRRIHGILKAAQRDDRAADDVANEVEEAGDFGALSDFIRRNYRELTLLILAIGILVSWYGATRTTTTNVNVEVNPPPVERIIEQLPASNGDSDGIAKVGRNELCPCGSGRKYKHCHGAPDARN
jgi:hypothetical protein